jgi:hypothetical protein
MCTAARMVSLKPIMRLVLNQCRVLVKLEGLIFIIIVLQLDLGRLIKPLEIDVGL